MVELKDFISPRFVGKRFDNHTLPLEVLKDIAALEELVIELVKNNYIQDHKGRKRTPKQFLDGISLGIASIDQGSTIPNIVIQLTTSAALTIFPPENQQYLEKAKQQIIQTIEQAENGEVITGIPPQLLGYFDRLGRSLKDGESIEFNPFSKGTKAVLNRDTRRRLVLASQIQEIREEVKLRGIVSAMDKSSQYFFIQLSDEQQIRSPYELHHEPILEEAFSSFREVDPLRILVSGTAVYGRANVSRINRLEAIDHVSILDELDVATRLGDLRQLKDGWLEGKGKALSQQGSLWFENMFEEYYSDDIALPYLFPTGDGGLLLEWNFSPLQVSLEVDLEAKSGFYHSIQMDTDAEVQLHIDLSVQAGWEQLCGLIRPNSSPQI